MRIPPHLRVLPYSFPRPSMLFPMPIQVTVSHFPRSEWKLENHTDLVLMATNIEAKFFAECVEQLNTFAALVVKGPPFQEFNLPIGPDEYAMVHLTPMLVGPEDKEAFGMLWKTITSSPNFVAGLQAHEAFQTPLVNGVKGKREECLFLVLQDADGWRSTRMTTFARGENGLPQPLAATHAEDTSDGLLRLQGNFMGEPVEMPNPEEDEEE